MQVSSQDTERFAAIEARLALIEERLKLSSVAEPETEPQFRALVAEWKAGRGHTSSVQMMAMHPAYQRIIGMGEGTVPLLLAELKREPGHWTWALRAITGENPVPSESRGKLDEMAAA